MKRHDRLDSLRVISPCDVPWSSMKGNDAVRFCGKCSKNVYNVARMSRQEAVDVIERAEGRVCMQLSWRRDGTVATGDCWARLRRARRRGVLAFAVALPVFLVALLWAQAFGLRQLLGLFRSDPTPCALPQASLDRGGVAPIVRPPIVEPFVGRALKGKVAVPKKKPPTIKGEAALLGDVMLLDDLR